jgi:uncharacterized Ntn-hydrolase superfamily protein
MTFSIVAGLGPAYGVAVASKFLAVGATVPAAEPGHGAVATQALAKVSYKTDGLALLRSGADSAEAVRRLTEADPLRASRQVGVVGGHSAATFTGTECHPWAGGVAGGDDELGRYAIQGNILTGPQVLTAMQDSWLGSPGMPFARRLLAALVAGDGAGGDSRGRQSAALYVVDVGAGYDGCGVLADLRIDDHPDPVGELVRLLDLADLYFGGPEDVRPLEGELALEVAARLDRLGMGSADVAGALAAWAGIENLETRLTPDGIDGRVLAALRAATPEGIPC